MFPLTSVPASSHPWAGRSEWGAGLWPTGCRPECKAGKVGFQSMRPKVSPKVVLLEKVKVSLRNVTPK